MHPGELADPPSLEVPRKMLISAGARLAATTRHRQPRCLVILGVGTVAPLVGYGVLLASSLGICRLQRIEGIDQSGNRATAVEPLSKARMACVTKTLPVALPTGKIEDSLT